MRPAACHWSIADPPNGVAMPRPFFIFALVAIGFCSVGCTKSDDDVKKAQRATAGLMPAEEPKFEAEYVADQSQVKLVAARTVSYEPLETFRGKSKSEPKEEDSKGEKETEEPTAKAKSPARGAPSGGAPSGGGNFWTRVGMKALMGGAAPPQESAPNDDEPAAKDDKAGKKKEADDEEESEEEDSEASDDSGSNGN